MHSVGQPVEIKLSDAPWMPATVTSVSGTEAEVQTSKGTYFYVNLYDGASPRLRPSGACHVCDKAPGEPHTAATRAAHMDHYTRHGGAGMCPVTVTAER